MATVGEQIKEPEAGWRRYDDTHPGLKYTGTWTTPSPTNAGYYGGSIRVTSRAVDNNYVAFSFFGTKLRIISDFYSDRHSDNAITIDGVKETYSAFRAVGTSSLQQAIVYEKSGLTLGFHTVSIATGHNRINFTLDAIDIDETGYLYSYALTTPESGWKRIDDSSPQVAVSGNIARNTTDSNFHNTSAIFTQDTTGQINFKFYGTKFRLIGAKNTNRSTNIEIFINDVKDTSFSQNGTLLYKSMDYEKSGLSLGTYTVTIKGNGVYGLDAIDIDDYGYLVAQLGQQLTSPEAGWRRYDDSHSAIVYIGTNWVFQVQTGTSALYNSTHHYSAQGKGDNEVRVKFYGSKFRLISSTGTNFADDISVTMDGVTEKFNTKIPSATDQRQRLSYEKTNLPLGMHEVRLASGTNGDWRLDVDAIDIDSDGRLFHPDEVTNVAELEIGKRIRCHYQSSKANTIGTFSGLGDQTSDFIPVTSSTTPNGDFYFIMVEDLNGRKLLVADRNIQNSISWDTINASGMVGGVLVSLTELKEMSTSIRLFTGGINASDKDNEWDKYIVNSNLSGKVIAGENNVWNWSGVYSWTSTTNTYASNNRTVRGSSSVELLTNTVSNNVAHGFRPLMEVTILPMYRSLIMYDGNYKKWNAGWSTVLTNTPLESTFINEGMGDLSVLDRKSTNFNQTMMLNGNLGSGKVFKSTVDLKKYIEITNLSVK